MAHFEAANIFCFTVFIFSRYFLSILLLVSFLPFFSHPISHLSLFIRSLSYFLVSHLPLSPYTLFVSHIININVMLQLNVLILQVTCEYDIYFDLEDVETSVEESAQLTRCRETSSPVPLEIPRPPECPQGESMVR